MHLAMWSGPRNISTAMMRSWGNRPDTFVCDEPLYAHYLAHTGKDHPAAAEVIAHGEPDWRRVVAWLTGPIPDGKTIFFQKHMTHHLLPHISRDWLGKAMHCFLLRHPRDVLLSYVRIVHDPAIEDTGFPQQAEIFDWVRANTGKMPAVVDAQDVQNRPRELLGKLCDFLGVSFDEAMLSWPPGMRPTDGVWAPHWYKEVATSTGFRPYKPRDEPLPDKMIPLYEQCLGHYERLRAHCLR